MNEVRPPLDHGHAGGDRLLPADVLHHRDDGPLHAPDGAERAGRDGDVAARRRLTITPWLAYHVLRPHYGRGRSARRRRRSGPSIGRSTRGCRRFIDAAHALGRALVAGLPGLVGLALAGSAALALLGVVPLKMLPFDNKNELQVVIDMPEGTTLEATDRVVRELRGATCRPARGRHRRATSGPRARSTSTASCATTTCARARTWPTCASTSLPKRPARAAEPRPRAAPAAPSSSRSPGGTARASRSSSRRRGRP